MTRLILIHGLKHSGKSTLASHLIDGLGYVRVKMAEPLKNMVRSLLRDAEVPEELIEGYVEGPLKESPIPQLGGVTARALMMTLGEEWRNMHSHLLWTNIALSKASHLLEGGSSVVIDDIRYPFEIEAFRRFRPVLWVITRGSKHFEPFGEERHAGERPMDVAGFDFHFRNDWETPDPLWSLAVRVLAEHEGHSARMKALHGEAWPSPAAPVPPGTAA